jgi:hypothetical protein
VAHSSDRGAILMTVALGENELRVHAWLRRRPAPWWVLLLKGPEVSGSGASLGRARRDLAAAAYEWATGVLAGSDTSSIAPAPDLPLARQIVDLGDGGGLVDALMPRPDAVFPADDLRRAA